MKRAGHIVPRCRETQISREFGRAVAAAALCFAGVHCASAEAQVLRYRCTMIDGSVRVLDQNLAAVFPTAVLSCSAVSAPYAAASPSVQAPPRRTTLQFTQIEASARLLMAAPLRVDSNHRDFAYLVNSSPFMSYVLAASQRYSIDTTLLSALIYVESRFHPDSRSAKGAMGLMQVMPATAARYGVGNPAALYNPAVNVDVGAHYLRDLGLLFPGRTDLVLAAYNSGEGNVIKHGNRIPPFPETQDYVRQITALAGRY